MGNGTIQAKLEPLSSVDKISKIFFLRKEAGPIVNKVQYLVLPKICKYSIFNLSITPVLLIYYTIKHNARFIISYHIIPYAFFASIASFLTGRKYIVGQTGSEIERFSERRPFWLLLSMVLSRADKILVPGNKSLNHWYRKGISDDKLIILHSTIDTDKFVPSKSSANTYDFIYVGRFDEEKNLEFLLMNFSKLCHSNPTLNLLMVGDGSKSQTLYTLVSSLGIARNVHFVGFHENVLPFLYEAKYILLTSIMEGLPTSIMEGMSAGCIPVVSNVGNLSDLISHGENGFLFESNDNDNFLEIMRYVIQLPDNQFENISSKAREKIISNHSHQSSIPKWNNILV